MSTGELVSLHKWADDPSIFLVGIVKELGQTSVTMDLVDPDGSNDEALDVALDDIVSLDRNSLYLRRLGAMYRSSAWQERTFAPQEAKGVNRVRATGATGILLITHYTRILRYITPDFVHVFVAGRIVQEGGPELAEQLEAEGYERYVAAARA